MLQLDIPFIQTFEDGAFLNQQGCHKIHMESLLIKPILRKEPDSIIIDVGKNEQSLALASLCKFKVTRKKTELCYFGILSKRLIKKEKVSQTPTRSARKPMELY